MRDARDARPLALVDRTKSVHRWPVWGHASEEWVAVPPPHRGATVEFRDVNFAYPAGRDKLEVRAV